jgi:hypothetical protein
VNSARWIWAVSPRALTRSFRSLTISSTFSYWHPHPGQIPPTQIRTRKISDRHNSRQTLKLSRAIHSCIAVAHNDVPNDCDPTQTQQRKVVRSTPWSSPYTNLATALPQRLLTTTKNECEH